MRSTILKLLVPCIALTALVGCEASGILDAKAPSKTKKSCTKITTYDVLSEVSQKDNVTYGKVSAECGALLHTTTSKVDNDAYKKTLLLIKPSVYAKNSESTTIALGSDLSSDSIKTALEGAKLSFVSPAVTINDDPTLLTDTVRLTLARTTDATTATEYFVGTYAKDGKNYVMVDVAPEEDETANTLSASVANFGTYQIVTSSATLQAGDFELDQ